MKTNDPFMSTLLQAYLNPNRLTLAAAYQYAKEAVKTSLGDCPIPSLATVRRKLRTISPADIALARGEGR